MNKIPRTFCITLRETPIRTNEFLEEAAKHNLKVELFYGSFGKKLELRTKHPNKIEFPSEEVFMTDGEIGCTLSHYVLWNVLLYQPEEEFLILEDDALFEENFVEKFMDRYSKLPLEWQMVYVGWVFNGNDTSPISVKECISIRSPSATHAYLVKKSILSKLCNDIQPIQSPIDLTIINRVLPTIKYYVFDPPLITQKSFRSLFSEKDANWMSVVYDWKNDLYEIRQKLLQDFRLGDGWYDLERNITEIWKWSNSKFTINLPPVIDAIKLEFTMSQKNTLKVQMGSDILSFELNQGVNEILIPCNGAKFFEGTVEVPFIPKNEIEESNDTRSLGICLKNIVLLIKEVEVDISIDTIWCPN